MIIEIKEKYKKEERVLVECDFKSSPKCKNKYYKLYKNILIGRIYNNNKDRCQYCFNSLTKIGKQNYNFKYEKNENFFENIDNELKAYLLGWIAGDGSIKKDGLFFEISNIDFDILELFRLNLSPNNFCFNRKGDKGKNTICWKIHSVKIVKDLLKHLKLKSYGKKCDKIKLPDLPQNLLWVFVRGLFDSDGSVISPLSKKTRPEASICSISKQMQIDIKNFCISQNIKFIFTEGYSSIIFGGQECLKFLDHLYNNASYYLVRKKALYVIWKTWRPGFGTIIRPRKIRKYYPPISAEHKEKIRESNKKRKGIKYVRN